MIERVRAAYRELKAFRRVRDATGISEERIAPMVADLVPEVRGITRRRGAYITNGTRADRVKAKIRRNAWRCGVCLAVARGDSCPRGHPAPWQAETVADFRPGG